MKVPATKCKNCGDIIFSRARHDFRECSCGQTFIDGGFSEYCRIGGNVVDTEKPFFEIEIEQTKEELYIDYNSYKDKYGVIKT